MATNKIKQEDYIYKLIPDMSVISYLESTIWTDPFLSKEVIKSERYDDDLFSIIFDFSIGQSIDTKSYRALIVSDVELKFEESYDESYYQLENYSGRYIYVGFSSDIDIYRKKLSIIPKNISEDGYIFILRF